MKQKFLIATVLVVLVIGAAGFAGLVALSNHVVVQSQTDEDLQNVALLLSRGALIALPSVAAGQKLCFTLNSYEGSVGLQAQKGLTMLKLPPTGYVTGAMGANIQLTVRSEGIYMRENGTFDWSCLFSDALAPGNR